MNIIQKILPATHPGRPYCHMIPTCIKIHYTDLNSIHDTEGYVTNEGLAVPHFTVHDSHIVQHLYENETGWYAGNGLAPRNIDMNSIAIAIYSSLECDAGYRRADHLAVQLVADLMQRYNIPFTQVSLQRNPDEVLPTLLIWERWEEFQQKIRKEWEASRCNMQA